MSANLDTAIEVFNEQADDLIECAKHISDENKRLTALIEEHNRECEGNCRASNQGREQDITCARYEAAGKRCPDCPRHHMIDLERKPT